MCSKQIEAKFHAGEVLIRIRLHKPYAMGLSLEDALLFQEEVNTAVAQAEERRRARVQGDTEASLPADHPARLAAEKRCGRALVPFGTISWAEHQEAWEAYAKVYGKDQSAERIEERHGFSYSELLVHLGHEPKTWEPR